jgi:hypothetical protein
MPSETCSAVRTAQPYAQLSRTRSSAVRAAQPPLAILDQSPFEDHIGELVDRRGFIHRHTVRCSRDREGRLMREPLILAQHKADGCEDKNHRSSSDAQLSPQGITEVC